MTPDAFTIFGDSISGNCLKVRYLADYLGLPYRWIETSVLKGETRTVEFLAMNPAGQVPLIRLPDGALLAQSNAILIHLGEDSDLIPSARYDRALMLQWLFWEQYSHETSIAVRRFHRFYLGKAEADIDPGLKIKGDAALALMERHLADRTCFVGRSMTLADVSLVAYTRLAHEGGFDLGLYPSVRRWVEHIEGELRI